MTKWTGSECKILDKNEQALPAIKYYNFKIELENKLMYDYLQSYTAEQLVSAVQYHSIPVPFTYSAAPKRALQS
jgi:hypothetical protein